MTRLIYFSEATVGQGSCVVGYDSCLPADAVCEFGQCICSGTLVFDGTQCVAPTNGRIIFFRKTGGQQDNHKTAPKNSMDLAILTFMSRLNFMLS